MTTHFSQVIEKAPALDRHVVITWRAFKEILVDGPEADRIFQEIGDRFLHISALDMLRAVADLPDKKTRWQVGCELGEELTESNRFGDQLVVSGLDEEWLEILYEYGPEADEPGLIPIADTLPETLGRLITRWLSPSPEEYPHPHDPHLSKVINQVHIIDVEPPAEA